MPLQGLGSGVASINRALPYPDDYKAFSLSLTDMDFTLLKK